jgi:uncharacterized protein
VEYALRYGPLVLAMFVAGEVSGMTGFGVGVVGSITLAILIGPKSAVILLSILSTFTSINQVLKFRHELHTAERLVWLLFAALIGAAVGSYLLIWLPYSVLATLLGAFTLIYVVISLIGYRPRVSPAAERVMSPAVGLVAGVVNSTVGSSGPVLGPYMLALGLAPSAFILSISVTFLVMGTVRVITLAALGVYTWPVVAAGLGLLIPTFCGQMTGFWLQTRVPRHVFERLILLLLAVAAVYLVYRGAISLSA